MKNVKIYYTSDIHGNLMPVDYTGIGRKKGGLLCIAEEMEHDGNTLVLDGGDSLQGTPLVAYYLEHRDETDFHPVAEAFAAMGLSAFTLGNHDFNFGYEALCEYVQALKKHGALCLCANVKDKGGRLGLLPWHVFELENGLRVGVTGIVTDFVNVWEKPEHLELLEITDAFEAAEKNLQILKDQGCDMTVCIYHGGYERELSSGKLLSESRENRACLLGEKLDYDLLLTGHQHMAVEGTEFGKTFSCQPPDKADRYFLIRGEQQSGSWSFHADLVSAGDSWDKEKIPGLPELEEKTQRWLDEKIGNFDKVLPPEGKLEAALYGSRVAALINQVQMEKYGTDFSCTSLTNDPIGFPEQVSIRDVYTAYPFANVCVVKEVTGKTLRQALERCASYFDLKDGKPVVSDRFLKPKVEHYNYDFYAGLDYAFDIRKPLGERVVRLQRLDGTPVGPEDRYTLVCSDYRASGTGGYEMIRDCPVLFTGADNTQDLLVDYIRSHKSIHPADNYRIQVYTEAQMDLPPQGQD